MKAWYKNIYAFAGITNVWTPFFVVVVFCLFVCLFNNLICFCFFCIIFCCTVCFGFKQIRFKWQIVNNFIFCTNTYSHTHIKKRDRSQNHYITFITYNMKRKKITLNEGFTQSLEASTKKLCIILIIHDADSYYKRLNKRRKLFLKNTILNE